MKKGIIALIVALAVNFSCLAQGKVIVKGSKNVTSKTTKIDSFKRLVLNENFKITLEKGMVPKITVETDDNIHKFVETKVNKDGTLDLFISAIIRSKQALNVTVTYVDGLESIEIKDNAEISSSKELEFKNVDLKTSGNSNTSLSIKAENFKFSNEGESKVSLNVVADKADLELNSAEEIQALINAKEMNIAVKNSASADISGQTDVLNVQVEKESKFNGSNLDSKVTNLTSGTASQVQIKAIENLNLETTGSSNITVSENPKIAVKGIIGTLTLKRL